MSLDSLGIAALCDELREAVWGARVQRVIQIDEDSLGLELYARRRRRWLLLSADPERPRVHLAGDKLGRSTEKTSPLLLILRKHLRSARLIAVEQPELERVVRLTFGVYPERDSETEAGSGSPVKEDDAEPSDEEQVLDPFAYRVCLIAELIGRYSNLILTQSPEPNDRPARESEKGAEEIVLECVKRIGPDQNRYRVVLPRHPYVAPPPQAKLASDLLDAPGLAEALAQKPAENAASVLVSTYSGFSPQLAREVVFRATGRVGTKAKEASPERLVEEARAIFSLRQSHSWQPCLVIEKTDGGVEGAAEAVVAFAPYHLSHLESGDVRRVVAIETISEGIERFTGESMRFRPVDQARAVAIRSIRPRREAAMRKISSLGLALEGGGRADELREKGEAIIASIHNISRGQSLLVYGGNEIALDPGLSASDNAQRYFKRYRKARGALEGVPALIGETSNYLRYLDEALAHIANAENADVVRGIVRDLGQIGKARPDAKEMRGGKGASRQGRDPRGKRGKDGKEAERSGASGITRYRSSDGIEILAGQSGRSNDYLTFELAGGEDIWLHARGVPGAHVILRSGGAGAEAAPPEKTLEEAAKLAAFNSASRAAGLVDVDWTRRRYVRRIRAGLPGLVNYTGEKTLRVSPENTLSRKSGDDR